MHFFLYLHVSYVVELAIAAYRVFLFSLLAQFGSAFCVAQNWRNQQEITSQQRAKIAEMDSMTNVGVQQDISRWKVIGLVRHLPNVCD